MECAGEGGGGLLPVSAARCLHPLPLLALLDEIMGWDGF